MSGVKSVSRHEEVSAGGGSFAPQGGPIAWQNLAIRVSRATCLAISTNLSSGWLYQDHRWSLINKYVVFIKRMWGPILTTVRILWLIIKRIYKVLQGLTNRRLFLDMTTTQSDYSKQLCVFWSTSSLLIIISHVSRTTWKWNIVLFFENSISLDFSFVNIYFFLSSWK